MTDTDSGSRYGDEEDAGAASSVATSVDDDAVDALGKRFEMIVTELAHAGKGPIVAGSRHAKEGSGSGSSGNGAPHSRSQSMSAPGMGPPMLGSRTHSDQTELHPRAKSTTPAVSAGESSSSASAVEEDDAEDGEGEDVAVPVRASGVVAVDSYARAQAAIAGDLHPRSAVSVDYEAA